jgi:hypothetical protein
MKQNEKTTVSNNGHCGFLLPPYFIPIIHATMTQAAHVANTTPIFMLLLTNI